jgi:ferrous iron transport protein A
MNCCRSVTKANAIDIVFGNYSHLPVYSGEKSLGLEAVRLSALKVKQTAMITKVNRLVDDTEQPDLVAIRLESLGFVPGTQVQVITKGIFGGDPILIQIGFTRFALRKTEADKIEIQFEGAPA